MSAQGREEMDRFRQPALSLPRGRISSALDGNFPGPQVL